MKYAVTAEDAQKVARAIGSCDFSAVISRSVGPYDDTPWVVTVGEPSWQRHLVIQRVSNGGGDAVLELLDDEQSDLPIKDLNTSAIERTIALKVLIAGSYVNVKRALQPWAC